MPDVPGNGWENWIIGTLIAMVTTMVTTIVAVVRFIQGQYVQQIEELQKSVATNTSHLETLNTASIDCFEDRARLQVKVEHGDKVQNELAERVAVLERQISGH